MLAAGPVAPGTLREHLRSLSGIPGFDLDFDAEKTLEALVRAGLIPGSPAPPELAAGDGRPAARRGAWRISLHEWQEMVEHAARAARELDRPEPPETPVRREFLEKARAAAQGSGGTAAYTALRLAPMFTAVLEDGGGGLLLDRSGMAESVRELCEAEAHPERGSWFFVRVRVTSEGSTVERAYDHRPDWDVRFGIGPGAPVHDLRAEMARRSAEWRPDWVWLLDEEIPFDPPAALVPSST